MNRLGWTGSLHLGGCVGPSSDSPGGSSPVRSTTAGLAPDIGGGSLRATKGGMPAPHRSTPAASARPVIVQLWAFPGPGSAASRAASANEADA